ncbi:MAG: phosphoribosylformylglycinamidine synthase subunit PurQ [Desulfobacter sp.]|nr:phosphoribosylformylglycinamidine synthase subunit PurQ [Desulfobacter sp.]WDP86858.1 MAG: phosphoribosylformylglycinamidine synthase subunit PurQ [Desulfobacter sp.]
MNKVKALILTGFGLNCDNETALAFEMAGAQAHKVHINTLIQGKERLEDYHILAFGGGFSWGDDHGAGVIQALKLKNNIGKDLLDFVGAGKLVIGICNGFQALVNLGLLPGFDGEYTRRSVAITFNDCGNFRDQWVSLVPNENSACVFTRGLGGVDYPVRHGEGKVVADPAVIDRLLSSNQVVFQYADAHGRPAKGAFPENPNGAVSDIAGICDPTGRIFGLMPHPEAYNHFTNHPDWPKAKEIAKRQGKASGEGVVTGVRLFENGVNYIRDQFF